MHSAQTLPLNARLPALLRACALALACAAVGSAAHAQSSVQLYGLLDVSVGSFQNAGGLKLKREDSGNMSTSYFGLKGSEDLGGGLRANFQLESFLLLDSGGASRVPGVDAFWARNANVSLSGSYGALKLGRQAAPLFVSTLVFNAFSDSFGYSPAIRQYFIAPYGTPVVGDTAWSNSIGYSGSVGGLSANVMVAAGEGSATARGHNVGGNVLYFGGPVGLTAVWQSVKAQGVLGQAISTFPGFTEQTSYQVGGSFDAGVVKLFAQYGVVTTDAIKNVKSKIMNFSASVPLGGGSLLAEYGNSKITTTGAAITPKSDMFTFGYDYFLSKRTDIYAIYMLDKYTGVANGSTFALGLKLTF